jgi:hypothetical protein
MPGTGVMATNTSNDLLINFRTYAPGDEVIEKRTEYSKTVYLGKDGENNKYSLTSAIGSIHYKDDYSNLNEVWKDIDLTPIPGKTRTEMIVKTAPYELAIDGLKVTVKDKKTGSITMIELTDIGTPVTGSTTVSVPELIFSNGIATAKNIYLDTDLEISWDTSCIKFTRILKSDKAPTLAKFNIEQTGSGITLSSKAEDSKSGDDKEVVVTSSVVNGVLTESIDTFAISLIYPVRIDPSLEITLSDVHWFGIDGGGMQGTNGPIGNADYFGYIGRCVLAIRYGSVSISSGSTIDSAYIRHKSQTNYSNDTVRVKIVADQSADSAALDTYSNYAGRTKTANSADWNFTTDWATGSTYNTSDFKNVIQELVTDYGGLSSANIVIGIEDNGSDALASRYGYSDTTNGPRLFISYTESAAVLPSSSSESSGLGLLSFGHVKANQTYDSGLDAFEMYNAGAVAIDATIAGEDLVGGIDWTLSDTCTAGNNTYGLKAGINGGSFNVTIKKTPTYNLLITDLAALSSQKFGIQMYSPTDFSDGVVKTATVTLTITAH